MRSLRKWGRVLVVTHKNADPDAVASSVAMKHILESQGIDVTLVFPENASLLSRLVLKRLGIRVEYEMTCSDKVFDCVVTLDTSNAVQLGDCSKVAKAARFLVTIDHHENVGDLFRYAELKVHFPNASSTSEIVYRLFRGFLKGNSKVLTLLISGVVFDTRRFFTCDADVLEAVARMASDGGNYRDAVQALQYIPPLVERIARVKAAMRCRAYIVQDKYLVAVTHVSAYEASAARALMELGADLAIAICYKKNVVRVSARATENFVSGTGKNIGTDVMPLIGRMLHGNGGGHRTAGAATGKVPNIEYAYRAIENALIELFGKKNVRRLTPD